jgi:phospholipid/cholesterol/gamma-HCH transport system substrate-binding protein
VLRRTTKIQLILFIVITLVGVSYVAAEYVGLAKYVTGDNGCKVSAEFPSSGGIFTNAEVTYRGVTVGQVGALHLIKDGVRVDLQLKSCDSPKIPTNVTATVANRSVVGEQYVDLEPTKKTGNDAGPFVKAHSVLPMRYADGKLRNQVPTPTEGLLTDIDRFVTSVPLDDLRTTVQELRNATENRGLDLGALLDAQTKLVETANAPANLQATIDLIEESNSVLQTQLDQQQPLASWTHSLALLSDQLKKSDPDIRRLIDHGSGDLTTIRKFITDNRTDFGVTLANLVTVGNLLVNHLDGIEEVLELYPAMAAGGQSLVHGGSLSLALVMQSHPDPQDCGDPDKGQEGYYGTVRRQPGNLAPIAPNTTVRCTAPASGPGYKQVRGSANVPGGDPISTGGAGVAYPRATTANTVRVGPAITATSGTGDDSWIGLITDALR